MVEHSCPSTQQAWRTELRDLIRGASGGFLFGIPLLYTMEVWWIGSYTQLPSPIGVLAITFVIIFLLNRTDGFRRDGPDRPAQAAIDAVEELAIGIVCATFVLILLQEITDSTPLSEALGKIIFETIPFSIGVALARTMLSGDEEQEAAQQTDAKFVSQNPRWRAILADIGATLIGAIIVAFNVAPTDEVPMLAAAVSAPWLLVLIAASLIISYGIVFVAGLTAQQKRLQQEGLFQRPLVETALAYLLSLIAAAFMLWFLHRLNFSDPWTLWLRHTIILGLPATIGGAAGRLAV